MDKSVTIMNALEEDLENILTIQKRAYQSEAELVNDFSIPPLTQTIDEIKDEFNNKLFLKAVIEETIIGSVRGYLENGTCYIGRLIVDPEFQYKGIGKSLMIAVEEHFKETGRYELFTGKLSRGNIRFYESLEYRIFQEKNLNEGVTLVYMEKYGPCGSGDN